METSRHSLTVSSKNIVVHNVSTETGTIRFNDEQKMQEIVGSASRLLPKAEAQLLKNYLSAWSVRPQATAVDILRETDATPLRGRVQEILDFLEWRRLEGRTWNRRPIARLMGWDSNWNKEKRTLVNDVIQEAKRLADCERFNLLEYQRLADGYLHALREGLSIFAKGTGALWEEDFSRLRRDILEMPTTMNLSFRDLNRGRVFGIGNVQLLHPREVTSYDFEMIHRAYGFGGHDLGYSELFGKQAGSEASFGEYLDTTLDQLSFYESFEAWNHQQDSTNQPIEEAWWFHNTHESLRPPTRNGLLQSRLGEPRRGDHGDVEDFVAFVQHPLAGGRHLGFIPDPPTIYRAIGRFSKFVQEQGGFVPDHHFLDRLEDHNRAPFIELDVASRYSYKLSKPAYPDDVPVKRFSTRSDGNGDPEWSMAGEPPNLAQGVYFFRTTIGALKEAGAKLYRTRLEDGKIRIVAEHEPWAQVPGNPDEVVGWTLPDHKPLLNGNKLWNGSSFRGSWVDRKGIIHSR